MREGLVRQSKQTVAEGILVPDDVGWAASKCFQVTAGRRVGQEYIEVYWQLRECGGTQTLPYYDPSHSYTLKLLSWNMFSGKVFGQEFGFGVEKKSVSFSV